MAQRAEAFRSGRFYLPTQNLTNPTTKFGNITPAFNNNYDVMINFEDCKQLKGFINQHGFYDQNGGAQSLFNPGTYLALFCSEAVLPGSELQAAQVSGLRQGITQKYASFRRFPDIILTYYLQTDYYTNDVFNAWMEFISPTRIQDGTFGTDVDRRKNTENAYRRMKYPKEYKCNMEITAFDKDITSEFSKMNKTSSFNAQIPSSMTYHIINAFPTNIVAAPLAYGRAELIKTTITFTYEQFFTSRTSRKGSQLEESDASGENIRNPDLTTNIEGKSTDNESTDNTEQVEKKKNSKDKTKKKRPFTREEILATRNKFVKMGL